MPSLRRAWPELRDRGRERASAAVDSLPPPGRTVVQLAVRSVRESFDDRVPGLAAEATLFVLISLPALLLVVLGSLGLVASRLGPDGTDQLDRLVLDVPHTFLSDSTYAAWAPLARDVMATGRADVVGIGLVLALWTGSRATSRVLETLVIAYDLETPRSSWRRRGLALLLTVGGLLGAVAVLPVLVLGPRLVAAVLPGTGASEGVPGWLLWPLLGLLVLVGLTTLFHVGVPWHTPWRRDLPGAVLAMVLWLAAAAGLRAYLALGGLDPGDAAGSVLYHRLGTPIAVTLWLYVSSIAVLVGGELNAEIERTWPTSPQREKEQAAQEG